MTFDTHARNVRHNIRRACAFLGRVCASDSGLESGK